MSTLLKIFGFFGLLRSSLVLWGRTTTAPIDHWSLVTLIPPERALGVEIKSNLLQRRNTMYSEILIERVRLSKIGKIIIPVIVDNKITPVFLTPESANKLFRALDENLRLLRGKEK